MVMFIINLGIRYLAYSDIPRKADAVVLFLGPDAKARQDEANLLLRQDYARYLLIPTYGIIECNTESKSPRRGIDLAKLDIEQRNKKRSINTKGYAKYIENTHIEIMEAKRMMDEKGLRSAIFVSSPLHMRRIRLMSERLFKNDDEKVIFVATRFEAVHNNISDLAIDDWKVVAGEYVKISWYMLYSLFDELQSSMHRKTQQFILKH